MSDPHLEFNMNSKRTLFSFTICFPLVFPVSVNGISIHSPAQTKHSEDALMFSLALKLRSTHHQILMSLPPKNNLGSNPSTARSYFKPPLSPMTAICLFPSLPCHPCSRTFSDLSEAVHCTPGFSWFCPHTLTPWSFFDLTSYPCPTCFI